MLVQDDLGHRPDRTDNSPPGTALRGFLHHPLGRRARPDQMVAPLPEVGQLLAKGEVFERQLHAGEEGVPQCAKGAHEQGGHGWIMREGRKSRQDRSLVVVSRQLSSVVVTIEKTAERMTT